MSPAGSRAPGAGVLLLLGGTVALGLGALAGRDQLLAAILAGLVIGPCLLAVPLVRRLLGSPAALPLLLTAPAAVAVFPAVAVPLTTAVLLAAVVATRGRPLPARMIKGLALACLVGTLGVLLGVLSGAALSAVAGDALQFGGLYLAAVVAWRRDPDLLGTRPLWALWCGMVLISAANATGRVDFLVEAGSDLQRNINFVAPVVLIWGLVNVLWRRPGPAALLIMSSGAVLTLLSFTRGIWAGAAVGCFAVLVVHVTGRAAQRRWGRMAVAAGLLVLGAAVLHLTTPHVAEVAAEKLASLFHRQSDFTYNQRGFETDAVLAQRGDHLLGRGFGADYVVPAGGTVPAGPRHYIHNQYVAQLFRNGLAGTVLTALTFPLLVRLRRGGAGSALALGTLGYVLVTGITSPSLFTYPTNLLTGLAIGGAVWLDRPGRTEARTPRGAGQATRLAHL